MKPHRILVGFKGSQDGHDHHVFEAGTTKHLSDGLARIAVGEGWAVPVDTAEEDAVPAPMESPSNAHDALEEGESETAVDRSTDEEKSIDAAPANKMKKPPKKK